MLTPTLKPCALEWRARCRAHDTLRRAQAAKPTPQPGQVVVFDTPVRFQDGLSFTRLWAIRLPRRRGIVFRSEAGGLYQIPKLRTLAYRIEAPAGKVQPPLI